MKPNQIDNKLAIKLISMGDIEVGKSCLIKRYCEGNFVKDYITTIGIDYGVKKIPYNDCLVNINIFDFSGDDDYKSVRYDYYEGSLGVLMVYDVNIQETFDNLERWEKEAAKKIKKYLCMMDSMTEGELNCKDKIDDNRAKRIAKGSGCYFIEVKLMLEEYKKFSKIVSRMGGLVKGKGGDITQIQRNPGAFMNKMGSVIPQNILNKMGGTGGIMNMMKEFQNLEGLGLPIKKKKKK